MKAFQAHPRSASWAARAAAMGSVTRSVMSGDLLVGRDAQAGGDGGTGAGHEFGGVVERKQAGGGGFGHAGGVGLLAGTHNGWDACLVRVTNAGVSGSGLRRGGVVSVGGRWDPG